MKNREYLAEITDIGEDGEGIGHICEGESIGFTVFVKGALPGERVRILLIKAKKRFGYGKLLEVLVSSADRRKPICPVASPCGGCQLQHLAYHAQLAWKEKKIKSCLERIGGISLNLEPIDAMDMPLHYRNKAQLPVGKTKDGNLSIGFYAGRTHTIINAKNCCIQAEINHPIIDAVRKFLLDYQIEPYNEYTHTGLVRHILIRAGFATGEIMVCLVVNAKKLPYEKELVQQLLSLDLSHFSAGFWHITSICLNINTEKTNVIMGVTCRFLWGKKYITDQIGENKYHISPLSFYQVNPFQTKKLYDTALSYAELTGTEIVWDLYCGIGTISLFLARRAGRIYGVEIIPEAVENARENARINQIDNAQFFCGAAEEILPKWHQKHPSETADVIVVDPPRKGCDEKLLHTIAAMQPKRIVYISCNPATLARDMKYLIDKGYVPTKGRGNDMFGNSVHVECVVLMSRVEK